MNIKIASALTDTDREKAKIRIRNAVELAKKIKYKRGIAEGLNIYGWIEILNGDYPGAMSLLLEGLNVAQEMNNENLTAGICNNISTAYHYQGPVNFSKAIEYIEKALRIYQKTGYKKGIAQSYLNLGGIYIDNISQTTFNMPLAEDYFNKALAIYIEQNCANDVADIYGALSYICSCRKQFDKAVEYINKSLKIFEDQNNKNGIMYTYFRLGDISFNLGQHQKAIDLMNKALNMAREADNKDMINNIYEMLSNFYAEKGDYKTALEKYRASVKLKFELYNEERIKAFADLEKKYETEKKEKEIQLLNKEALI